MYEPRFVSCDDTFSVLTNIKSGAGWRNVGKCRESMGATWYHVTRTLPERVLLPVPQAAAFSYPLDLCFLDIVLAKLNFRSSTEHLAQAW